MNLSWLLKKIDWVLLGSAVFLSLLGILELTQFKNSSGLPIYAQRQAIYLVLGILVAIFVANLDYGFFRTYKYGALFLYTFSISLLIALFFTNQITRGTIGWFKFGAFNFEPSELVKLSLIIILAKYFSWRHVEISRPIHIFISAAYFILPAALIILQPDLGSVIILSAIWLAIILFSGIKFKHLVVVVLTGIIVSVSGWIFVLMPYQKARIASFIFPQAYSQGASYNQTQSVITIGSSGFFGKGLSENFQTKYGFLPSASTDFIFAAFVESFGFLGALLIMSLYLVLLWRLVRAAFYAPNNFSRLFLVGVFAFLFAQIFINIGMNLGIMPVTGITLPLVSFGGSSMIITFLSLGIAESIIVRS
ncbi:MAG: FtsW/RodA/SpoVE family cell cycle protein [Patescibacteria group bacterium]